MVAEQELVRQGLPVVVAVSRRIARRLGGAVSFDDLIGIGNLALVDIAREWDPERASFASYARARLKFAIVDGVRRETRGRAAQRAAGIIASDRLADEQPEAPESEEPPSLADDQAALADLLDGHAAALALGHLATPPGALLSESPEEQVGRAEMAHVLRAFIGDLPDRERSLMERHYFGDEPFDLIAQDLGISKSWASRLHERAVEAVKLAMRDPVDLAEALAQAPDPSAGAR
jgi:RNA polymerase sigma factor for flagellar operon FliA